jgi:hypothetical protein
MARCQTTARIRTGGPKPRRRLASGHVAGAVTKRSTSTRTVVDGPYLVTITTEVTRVITTVVETIVGEQ